MESMRSKKRAMVWWSQHHLRPGVILSLLSKRGDDDDGDCDDDNIDRNKISIYINKITKNNILKIYYFSFISKI